MFFIIIQIIIIINMKSRRLKKSKSRRLKKYDYEKKNAVTLNFLNVLFLNEQVKEKQ